MVVSGSLMEAHNVRVVGEGDQVVVLGHGFGTDQSIWKYILPALLNNDMKVVLYDMMGAGTTDFDDFSFNRYSTLHAYADDLLNILDELEIDSCIYVGHSVSGMIGCLASIERPEIFQKLILLAASPRYLNDSNYYGGFDEQDLVQLFSSMKSNFQAWVSGFAPAAVGADIDDRAVQDFSRTLFSMRSDVALSVGRAIFYSDLRGILPQVTVPCHIIQSQKDLAVPVEVAEYLRRNLGGWTSVEILEIEGHFPMLSFPDVLIPVFLRCIQED